MSLSSGQAETIVLLSGDEAETSAETGRAHMT